MSLNKRLPAPKPADPAEREYYRDILTYLKLYNEILSGELELELPHLQAVAKRERVDSYERMDANIAKSIASVFARTISKLNGKISENIMNRWATAMLKHTNKRAKANFSSQVEEGTGTQMDRLIEDGKLTPYFKNVAEKNVELIKSIPIFRQETLKNQIIAAITSDARHETIQSLLEDNYDMSKRKARVVARDQVQKFNGAVDKYRQTTIGVKRYIWRTAGDERVRKNHRKANGKTFSWDDPKVRGTNGELVHPKEDIQCRCYAEPIFDDLFD